MFSQTFSGVYDDFMQIRFPNFSFWHLILNFDTKNANSAKASILNKITIR